MSALSVSVSPRPPAPMSAALSGQDDVEQLREMLRLAVQDVARAHVLLTEAGVAGGPGDLPVRLQALLARAVPREAYDALHALAEKHEERLGRAVVALRASDALEATLRARVAELLLQTCGHEKYSDLCRECGLRAQVESLKLTVAARRRDEQDQCERYLRLLNERDDLKAERDRALSSYDSVCAELVQASQDREALRTEVAALRQELDEERTARALTSAALNDVNNALQAVRLAEVAHGR